MTINEIEVPLREKKIRECYDTITDSFHGMNQIEVAISLIESIDDISRQADMTFDTFIELMVELSMQKEAQSI